ncbi:D-alanine--D-alanine ligase family protein [Syntrophomonas zehnderi]|nr:D-alanine--D-alanine ligase [Syntrophomonas zehnderi]
MEEVVEILSKERILVLMGGTSAEREVSLRSGKAVLSALLTLGYPAYALDYNHSAIDQILIDKPDLVFLALHGQNGEDGTVQGLLDSLDIAYTGSGLTSSVLCMDKVLSKKLFKYEGIPTAGYKILKKKDLIDSDAIHTLKEEIGLPMVIKAATQGSSIGTYIVRNEEDILSAINNAFLYSHEVLAEEFIDGKELTVALLGNEQPEVLPIIEITSQNEFYDYESKYTQGMFEHIIPARIDRISEENIINISKQVYELMNCKGFARIDFMLDKNGYPYVLEVNTIPGMTELSLVPDAARAAGMSFEELVERIVRLALKK